MLKPTRQFPIPKPIMSAIAIIVVLMVLGGIYYKDRKPRPFKGGDECLIPLERSMRSLREKEEPGMI